MRDLFVIAAFSVAIVCVIIALTLPFALISAGYRADLWNRCNPDTKITSSEAFWAAPDLTVCSKELKEPK